MSELDEHKKLENKGRDKNFTLVGELNGKDRDILEYSNLNIHTGDNWDIEDSEFDDYAQSEKDDKKGSE